MEIQNLDLLFKHLDRVTHDALGKIVSLPLRDLEFLFEFDLGSFISNSQDRWNDLKHIIFNSCTFHYHSFINFSDIDCQIGFIDTNFLRDFVIEDSHFNANVNFQRCKFECGKLDIHKSEFTQNIILLNCDIKNEFIFHHIKILSIELFNSEFHQNVNFISTQIGRLILNDIKFNQELLFSDIELDSYLILSNMNIKKLYLGNPNVIGNTIFKKPVYIENSTIDELKSENIVFETFVSLNGSNIKNIFFNNIYFAKYPLSISRTNFRVVQDLNTARVLKNEAQRASDSFMVTHLKARELEMYYKTLLWFKKPWDKLVLFLNKWSNSFGTNWIRGILFTVFVWILFFSLYVIFRDGWGDKFIWADSEYLYESAQFLWVLNGVSGLTNEPNFWTLLCFFLGKIAIGYGIFQTVAAFRKHGK